MCKYWKAVDNLDVDLSIGLEPIKQKKTRGRIPWTREEIAQYRDFWVIGSKQRLALELILWTGARIGDAVCLGWNSIDSNGFITFVQEKTGTGVSIPFNSSLPTFASNNGYMQSDLDNLKLAAGAINDRHLTIMTTEFGKPRSKKSASQWFSKSARDAGIELRTAHGLRKTRAIELVHALATPHQISSWTGHRTLAEIENYTREFDRKRTLMGEKEEQKVPTLLNKFQQSENKGVKSNG